MQKISQSKTSTKQKLQYDRETVLEKILSKIELLEKQMKQHEDKSQARADDIVGQLETLRDENTIGAYQTRELRETTDDHEKRIKKLEKAAHN